MECDRAEFRRTALSCRIFGEILSFAAYRADIPLPFAWCDYGWRDGKLFPYGSTGWLSGQAPWPRTGMSVLL